MNFTHINQNGQANMVDVSEKPITTREATAQAIIYMHAETLNAIKHNLLKKGEVLSVARIAGIQAAKQTAQLIPLCHTLLLSKIQIDFTLNESPPSILVNSYCKLNGQTGVEIEALTAASIAAITIFDMCKAIDKEMTIGNIQVLSKTGGVNGDYRVSKSQD